MERATFRPGPLESGGSDEALIANRNPLAASVAFKARRIEDVADTCSAPRAFAFGFADTNHRSQEWRKNARNNHGRAEKCAEPGEAKHGADNDAHGGDNYPKEKPTVGGFNGGFFRFCRRLDQLGCRLGYGPAQRTETPGN